MAAALAGQLVAQAPVRLAQETFFLREPSGLRLASLVPGLRLRPGKTSGEFVEVSLSGWIFTASTKPEKRDGFDLSVSAPGGENIRSEPDGAVLGKAVEGALWNRLSARGGWTQVRRSGWIARSALAAPVVAQRDTPAVRVPAPLAPAPPPASSASPPADSAVRRGVLKPGVLLQRVPDGETLASITTPTLISLGEMDREWVKVTVEGWVRRSDVQGNVAPLPSVTAAMLRQNPERYMGQPVDWRLQFLARQQADELRPEMPLGHAYLLTRGPLPETGFVYVLVSKEQADELQGLKPLDEISVRVTVRSARTRYLATPVVELVRIGTRKEAP